MNRVTAWCFVGLLSLSVLSGCESTLTSPPSAVSAGPQDVQVIQGSRFKEYTSIQQVNAESLAVVQITATSSRRQDSGSWPYVTTDVRVDRVIRGVVDGQILKIRETGSIEKKVVLDGHPALLLQAGQPYVLFLIRFTYGPGKDTDEYIPVGGTVGIFLIRGGILENQDSESPKLAAKIPLSELVQAVSR